MMHAIRIVLFKELLENIRDRRVVLSAFFFGVLMAPAIFGFATTLASKRATAGQDEPLELAVSGGPRAPNLLRFLTEHGVDVRPVTLTADEAIQAVRSRRHELVLVIDERYGARLSAGEPAPVDLVLDSANRDASAAAQRAQQLLDGYGRQIAALRLLVRGISPEVIRPIDVHALDVATPAGRSVLILGTLTYFCFMSMLVGGFYLAIDTTAGERERGSLEPLLALPVPRAALILGKMLATATFMLLSLLLTLAAFAAVLRFVPLEALGMSANFGPGVILALFAVMATFVPLGAALMTVVASFTRSNREAQSWLSVVMLLPTAPILIATVSGTKPTAALMAVPSLSQHLLATSLIRGESIPALHLAICAASTLGLGVLLGWFAIRLYHREAILG
jgi:sodium transport system permease protein